MRWSTKSALVVSLLALGSSASFAADLRGEVAAAYAAWNAAFNRGDSKAVAAAYAPDAVVMPPGHAVVSGSGPIEAFWAETLASGATDHTLNLIEAGGDGGVVYGAADWTARVKAEGGDKSFSGRAAHVFERQPDGTLKLKVHGWN